MTADHLPIDFVRNKLALKIIRTSCKKSSIIKGNHAKRHAVLENIIN